MRLLIGAWMCGGLVMVGWGEGASAQQQFCGLANPSATPPPPLSLFEGEWSQTYDWSDDLDQSEFDCIPPFPPVQPDELELAHAFYLPIGLHADKVLLLHFVKWPGSGLPPGPACELLTTQVFLFDPDSPRFLIRVREDPSLPAGTAFSSDVFCGGHASRKDGTLVVTGGFNGLATPPNETYIFDPTKLKPILTPDPPKEVFGEIGLWSSPFPMAENRY